MTQEEKLKLEMRLEALEWMVAKLLAIQAFDKGLTDAQYDEISRGAVKDAGAQTFPDLDPTQSDLAAGEWEEANQRLLEKSKILLAQVRSRIEQRRS